MATPGRIPGKYYMCEELSNESKSREIAVNLGPQQIV